MPNLRNHTRQGRKCGQSAALARAAARRVAALPQVATLTCSAVVVCSCRNRRRSRAPAPRRRGRASRSSAGWRCRRRCDRKPSSTSTEGTSGACSTKKSACRTGKRRSSTLGSSWCTIACGRDVGLLAASRRRIRSSRISTTAGAHLRHGEAGDDVGLVLVVGQHLVEHVGGVLVARIDAGAADFGLLEAVGMERDEEVGLVAAAPAPPAPRAEEGVVLARQRHVEPARTRPAAPAAAGQRRGRCPFRARRWAPRRRCRCRHGRGRSPPAAASRIGDVRAARPASTHRLPARAVARSPRRRSSRDLGRKFFGVSRDDVDHQPRRLVVERRRAHRPAAPAPGWTASAWSAPGPVLPVSTVIARDDARSRRLPARLAASRSRSPHVDGDAIRDRQRDHGELGRAGEIDDQPRPLRRRRDAHVDHVGKRHRRSGCAPARPAPSASDGQHQQAASQQAAGSSRRSCRLNKRRPAPQSVMRSMSHRYRAILRRWRCLCDDLQHGANMPAANCR